MIYAKKIAMVKARAVEPESVESVLFGKSGVGVGVVKTRTAGVGVWAGVG